MRPRSARALAIVAAAGLASLIGCSHGNDYYSHEPYINGKKIDPALALAEQQMARLLVAGDATHVLAELSAPPWRKRMVRFLNGYAGHPVTVERTNPADDATADETLSVTCRPGNVQHVTLTWGWFDGAWRAWPDYARTAADSAGEYPGCH